MAAQSPAPAATVVLLRDGPEGLETFLLRRHHRSAFMATAFVFPGGRLDPDDSDARLRPLLRGRSAVEAAQAMAEQDPSLALSLHVAAIRETFEEAGILFADLSPEAALGPARERLQQGAPWTDTLVTLGATLRLDALIPYARWVTPPEEPRRFDARFFLAEVPQSQTALHDELETTAGMWRRPELAVAEADAGELLLAPPTLRTLEDLARHRRSDDALREAQGRRPPLIDPVLCLEHDQVWVALPGDAAHPRKQRVISGPTRIRVPAGLLRRS